MEGFYIERDDLRQTYVVAKNETYKFVKGKRFLVYIAFDYVFAKLGVNAANISIGGTGLLIDYEIGRASCRERV